MTESTTSSSPGTSLTFSERDRIYRLNYYVFLADFVVFGVAINFIGATTVIPDFVRKLTDSEVLIGLSGQLFEIGWLLPQLLIARQLVRVERKKWWFIGPNIPVRLVMIIYGIIILWAGADDPTLLLVLFLVFYGIAALGDGLVGVPWIDLMGSSLDDRRRARLFGLGNALVGLGALSITPIIRLILSDKGPDFPNNYALLFLIAGTGFFITVPAMLFVKELPGGKVRPTIPPLSEYLPDLVRVLRHDHRFSAIMLTRVFATLFTLAGPFYVGFATEELDLSSEDAVPTLLFMVTVGIVASSLVYSRYGDRRNLLFIRFALVAGFLVPTLALIASVTGPALLYAAFLVNGLSAGTLYLSFINWVISHATPEQRPVYSGLFNSVSAVGLLIAPVSGGLIVQSAGYEAVFAAAMVMMACAIFVSFRYAVEAHPVEAPTAAD